MNDVYGGIGLPTATVEAARAEETRLVVRLEQARLGYEVAEALRFYRRAIIPLLTVFSQVTDAEGEATDEWIQTYVTERATKEAERLFVAALEAQRQSIAFEISYLRTARAAYHRQEALRGTNP
jgi:hypothetical protein